MEFLGEYEVKVDDKGRIMVPAGLRKQLPADMQDKFVLNRGFENCVSMTPYALWQKEAAVVNRLNSFVKKNREFQRFFSRGAVEITLDATGRMLIPKRLQEWAFLGREVIIAAYSNKFEIWAKDRFDSAVSVDPDVFSSLAEDVMGNKNVEDTD